MEHSFHYPDPTADSETFFPQAFQPQYEERPVEALFHDETVDAGFSFPAKGAVVEVIKENDEEVVVCDEGLGAENFGNTFALFGQ